MIRTAVLLILIGLAMTACVQSKLFRCKESPNTYCPK